MSNPLITLYTPGIRPELITKAARYNPDAVIIDLEDTVPRAKKPDVRGEIADLIPTLENRPLVRVNNEEEFLVDDLRATVTANTLGIILPKVETVDNLAVVDKTMAAAEKEAGLDTDSVPLILQIESALAVLNCYELCSALPRVASVTFGSAEDGDLQQDLGCAYSIEGTELLYARSKVLLDARAAKLPYVLDGAFSEIGNDEALRADCVLSRRLGYDGRTLIHPGQIEVARSVYALSAEQSAHYKQVVREFEAALKRGDASIKVNDRLIDYAMYNQARSVLTRFEPNFFD